MISVGAVTRIGVTGMDDFDYPQTGDRVQIISDGTSVKNEVLQQGSEARREKKVKGRLLSFDDVETLRGYYRSKETVTYDDPMTGETLEVIVWEFSASRDNPWIWKYGMLLVEA